MNPSWTLTSFMVHPIEQKTDRRPQLKLDEPPAGRTSDGLLEISTQVTIRDTANRSQ